MPPVKRSSEQESCLIFRKEFWVRQSVMRRITAGIGATVVGLAVLVAVPVTAAADSVATTVLAIPTPNAVALSPDGSLAYTANNASNSVSVIDTATNAVTATWPVANSPLALATSPDGTRLYVLTNVDSSMAVIDTATGSVLTSVPVGTSPYALAVSGDGTRVYVTNISGAVGSAFISVIDTATNTKIGTITEASAPRGVAVSPDGSRLYVAHGAPGSHAVSVIDTATGSVLASLAMPAGSLSKEKPSARMVRAYMRLTAVPTPWSSSTRRQTPSPRFRVLEDLTALM
jgi:YVTN family beta-propeller protein